VRHVAAEALAVIRRRSAISAARRRSVAKSRFGHALDSLSCAMHHIHGTLARDARYRHLPGGVIVEIEGTISSEAGDRSMSVAGRDSRVRRNSYPFGQILLFFDLHSGTGRCRRRLRTSRAKRALFGRGCV